MKPVVNARTIRSLEDAFFTAYPGTDLMGRAADAVAAAALHILGDARQVLVVVGPGNNGGDGLFAAATLARSGRRVRIWVVEGRAHDAGLAAATAAGAITLSASGALERLPVLNLVIDAYTGIGGRPGLPDAVSGFADACHAAGVPVLSVDVPSGLDADSHETPSSFVASRTVTFIALKACHVLQPAASRCGVVQVVDIGVGVGEADVWHVEPADVGAWWPVPGPSSDKYSRGVVRLDTGSDDYPGAAVLGALGATRSGAGLVRYVGPAFGHVLAAAPSVVGVDGRAQAQVIGSGWGRADRARRDAALALDIPSVIDAEALIDLPSSLPDNCLLTPHVGELARLLGSDRVDVVADPRGAVIAAAATWGTTVLLKGATQYVARRDGVVLLAPPGPAWTAQAGSGDVLAGIAGTLLAAGLPADKAGVMAAGVQALTASSHPGPWAPDDLARFLPGTIASLIG